MVKLASSDMNHYESREVGNRKDELALDRIEAVDPEGLRRLFRLLRASFATVIVDTSKGLQSSDFTAFELSDLILVVLQLDLVCLRNTARLLSLFRESDGLADERRIERQLRDDRQREIASDAIDAGHHHADHRRGTARTGRAGHGGRSRTNSRGHRAGLCYRTLCERCVGGGGTLPCSRSRTGSCARNFTVQSCSGRRGTSCRRCVRRCSR